MDEEEEGKRGEGKVVGWSDVLPTQAEKSHNNGVPYLVVTSHLSSFVQDRWRLGDPTPAKTPAGRRSSPTPALSGFPVVAMCVAGVAGKCIHMSATNHQTK